MSIPLCENDDDSVLAAFRESANQALQHRMVDAYTRLELCKAASATRGIPASNRR